MTSEHISMNSNFGLVQVICLSLFRVQRSARILHIECKPPKTLRSMVVEVTAAGFESTDADLVAVAAGAGASELGAPERAVADPVAIVYREPDPPLAVIALEPNVEGLRTAAARAVRACRGGGTVAWALDSSLPLALEEHVRALAEGAVIGGYYGRRWSSGEPPRGVERFVICECPDELTQVADRAALVARWTNVARELVDAPPNVISPTGLTERAVKIDHLVSEIVDPVSAGLGALAAVGGSSPIPPRLISSATNPPMHPSRPGSRSSARPSRSTPAATSSSRRPTSFVRRRTWRAAPRS